MIGEEIVDETDLYIDVHKRISVARARVQLYRQQQSDPSQEGSGAKKGRRRKWTSDISEPAIVCYIYIYNDIH